MPDEIFKVLTVASRVWSAKLIMLSATTPNRLFVSIELATSMLALSDNILDVIAISLTVERMLFISSACFF